MDKTVPKGAGSACPWAKIHGCAPDAVLALIMDQNKNKTGSVLDCAY